MLHDPNYHTPLSLASKQGNNACVQHLLSYEEGRKTLNIPGEMGKTPLAWAATNGRSKLVDILCAQPDIRITSLEINAADPSRTPDIRKKLEHAKAQQEAKAAIDRSIRINGGDGENPGHGTTLLPTKKQIIP